jgi:hypothetical protein
MIASGVSGGQNAPIMLNFESSRKVLSVIQQFNDESKISLNKV